MTNNYKKKKRNWLGLGHM